MYIRFKSKKIQDFGVDIVSIGNLSVGGSGKTPLTTALSLRYKNSAIVLRGYGRQSRGLVVVKDAKTILCDVATSGDEAMIYAQKVQNAIVIVSEDRKKAILKAKQMGAKIIFLDDAYSKHDIKKLDIIIEVDSKNSKCLPSGPFRERLWSEKEAFIVKDDVDFKRITRLQNKTQKMSLVTAIARPNRLDIYLPKLVNRHYFEDHHSFTKDELLNILEADKSQSLLVTYKDYVKIESFGLPISLLDMDVDVDENIYKIIDNYRENIL